MNDSRTSPSFRAEAVPSERVWPVFREGVPPLFQTDGYRAGYVYFFGDGTAIKIGFSSEPRSRLKQLQTSSPRPLELLHFVHGTEEDEKLLHRNFRHLHLNGEWFSDDGEIGRYVESLRAPKSHSTSNR